MLNENALNSFLILADIGSFQQAARRMGVSDASLSRYVAQAEEHVGARLFHRSRNSSTLTREGHAFLPIATALRRDLDRHAAQVAALRENGPGKLLIGCGPLTTRALIEPALRRVQTAMPDLRYRVLVSAYARPLDLLRAGQFDLFVGDLTYTPRADNVDIMVMAKRAICFVAHRDHPVHGEGPLTLAQMFAHPFAAPHLHRHWRASLITALGGDAAAEALVARLPQIESDDYDFLTSLLARPDHIVGGMEESFAPLLATGQVRRVQTPAALPWNICAARQSDNHSPAVDAFWQALDEIGR